MAPGILAVKQRRPRPAASRWHCETHFGRSEQQLVETGEMVRGQVPLLFYGADTHGQHSFLIGRGYLRALGWRVAREWNRACPHPRSG